MINYILFSSLILFQINRLMAYPSLFFQDQKHLSESDQNELHSKKRDENIFLSGLIYLDEEHWCLWINNKAFHSKNRVEIENYHLIRVTPQYAEFSFVSPHELKEINFKLRPYQTYIGKEQKIIDGIKN